jgi:hypothetical protein
VGARLPTPTERKIVEIIKWKQNKNLFEKKTGILADS